MRLSSFIWRYLVVSSCVLVATLRVLFGNFSWVPPCWLRWIVSRAWRLSSNFLSLRTSKPLVFWPIAVILCALVVGAVNFRAYLRALPQPVYVTLTADLPAATLLKHDAIINPLILKFSQSVANLNLVGKDVLSGISVEPALQKGTWHFDDDKTLVFRPQEDWKVGQNYKIVFSKSLFPSHLRLENYDFDFQSPRFRADIESISLYEDPVNPAQKKIISTVTFSHPIDKADFEKRISLKMRTEPEREFGRNSTQLTFKVNYDYFGGKAFLDSEQIQIPQNDSEVLLSIGSGIRSALGGSSAKDNLTKTVSIPSADKYFKITDIINSQVLNGKEEIDRIITIKASAQMAKEELAKNLEFCLLPKNKPATEEELEVANFSWSDETQVTPQVRDLCQAREIEWVPDATSDVRAYSGDYSFKYRAQVGDQFLIVIKNGLKSAGGYVLTQDKRAVIIAERFKPAVKLLHDGGLLSLTGEKKLSIVTRNTSAVKFTVKRLLPNTVHHLAYFSRGKSQNPRMWGVDYDNLSEVFSKVINVAPDDYSKNDCGKNVYSVFDFDPYLSSSTTPRGLFFLEVLAWDQQKQKEIETDDGYVSDERLVLVTDLGLIVKDNQDGSHDVFIQSISTGEPVVNAKFEVIGRNGLAVISRQTDQNGHAIFPSLEDFNNEQEPVVYVTAKDSDFSFLPIKKFDRILNMSRFETGGEYTNNLTKSLKAYLFSDRGIYRPGDEVNLGLVLKTNDWSKLPQDLPIELVINEPGSRVIKSNKIKFSEAGFEEYRFQTSTNSPTGSYTATLYIAGDSKDTKALLGYTTFKVEEFIPDRLLVKSEFTQPVQKGWQNPQDLNVKVNVRNLFGTPAVGNKVKGSLSLKPFYITFPEFRDYIFGNTYDPKNRQTIKTSLGELASNNQGEVEFALDLSKYEQASYNLQFVGEGFEKDSGRSVSSDVIALVAPTDHLIAYKPDGDLHYNYRDVERNVHFIAVNKNLQTTTLQNIEIELIEGKYVSVLTQLENGSYAYTSQLRKEKIKSDTVSIPLEGLKYKLDTSKAGIFFLEIKEHSKVVNEFCYQVVTIGDANRGLSKDAELQVKLNKREYEPGEEIEFEVQAPYVGSGLITIEKDKIYSYKWFKTETTSSVQKISLPDNLESNGYVTITFLRALDSKEIYTSPLSYTSVPFTVSKKRHLQNIELNVPELVRPGDKLKIQYTTSESTKLVLFGVDEGILQVTKYKTPDPFISFNKKKALEVTTLQILDLLLPEYHIVQELSAAGGDDGLFSRNLNPFKRKGQQPVAFWSGLLDVNGIGSFDYDVPDYFNGTMRIMAVAVSAEHIGVKESKVISRGDFVIQPTAPYAVSPDDEFEVSTLVANNIEGSGKEALIRVSLETSDKFAITTEQTKEIKIDEGKEGTAFFRLKVNNNVDNKFGNADIKLVATLGDKKASYSISLSIRPAQAFETKLSAGVLKAGLFTSGQASVDLSRQLHSDRRLVVASASVLPMGFAKGLLAYLSDYPHECTEQLVSIGFPYAILGDDGQLNISKDLAIGQVNRTISTLQSRQSSLGSFNLWNFGSSSSSPYVNVRAMHFLMEAKHHGYQVPANVYAKGIAYLKALANGEESAFANTMQNDNINNHSTDEESEDYESVNSESPKTEASARVAQLPTSKTIVDIYAQAYATYILSRMGIVTTNYITTLREALSDKRFGDTWQGSIVALYLASSYKLLKLDKEANELINNQKLIDNVLSYKGMKASYNMDLYEFLDDELFFRSLYLDLISNHFPEKLKTLPKDFLDLLLEQIINGNVHTLSSSQAILAFEAYSRALPPLQATNTTILEIDSTGTIEKEIGQGLIASANISPNAKSVKFTTNSKSPLYYQIQESGFDLKPQTTRIAENLEVYREFRNEKGNLITTASMTDKVFVHISLRVVDKSAQDKLSNVAIVDILPAGFEIDIAPNGLGVRTSLVKDTNTWHPDYIDVREDRLLFYGSADKTAQKFVYNIKPIAKGTFTVPPLYGEGMYDRRVKARSEGLKFTVVD